MFWMSATNPYGASPGLSQSDNGSEQVNTIHTTYHVHTIDMIIPAQPVHQAMCMFQCSKMQKRMKSKVLIKKERISSNRSKLFDQFLTFSSISTYFQNSNTIYIYSILYYARRQLTIHTYSMCVVQVHFNANYLLSERDV